MGATSRLESAIDKIATQKGLELVVDPLDGFPEAKKTPTPLGLLTSGAMWSIPLATMAVGRCLRG